MLGESSFEKNQKNNKDLIQTNDEMNQKEKIFNYFHNVLKKKNLNVFFMCLLLVIETIQNISYGFSDPHKKFWKIKDSKIKNINSFVGVLRITQILKYVKFDIYLVIWAILLVIVFVSGLLISMAIKFNKPNSSFFKIVVTYGKYTSVIMTSIGLIPTTELLLLMFKCVDKKIDIVKDPITCYKGIHYLYAALSIVFLLWHIFLILIFGIFCFVPFNNRNSTCKIDTSADLFYYILCVVNCLRYVFIKNEWISIAILLVGSLFNLKKGFDEPSYSNFIIQCFVMIRNSLFLWTSFMIMICKLTYDSKFDGNIYLFLFGMPLIIITCAICYKKESENLIITNVNSGSANDFISRTKNIIALIDKFIEKYKSVENAKKGYDKNDIFLKGLVSRHLETCIDEECPLTKYMENQGNYQIQKACLLHYINTLLINGMKKFPNNKTIVMTFIQFNYSNKFNLNAAKTYLSKLEKENNTISEDYILFCIKQNVNSLSNNKVNSGLNGENDEMEKMEEITEHKFRKLKYLIESTTKLYGEFWGVLSTNLTNNLNLEKLYFLGNKLNILLDEITQLWEKDLKSKKIDLENQSIVQLYAYFVREILRNKIKADEITKKLNEEQHFESKKNESDKFDPDNLDIILEDQDYVIYCRTNEKGDCSILQCSNSIVNLLGFTKQNLIGKKIETLMPSIFVSGHAKVISNKLKFLRKTNPGMNKTSDKKQIFLLPRTKVGYILPALVKFTVYNDDDFSNTFIIKVKMESKDPKSVYAFYILAKDDFTIDSFSSSALTMGLTMDLLKKYVVNLNILIRSSENSEAINLLERFNEFEDEPKRITWVFPDIIYPKNDTIRKNEENVEELVKQSVKKDYNLLITKMKLGEEEVGFCLRFTTPETKKNNIDFNDFKQSTSKLIMYDILKLNFIRTHLVTEKKNPNEEYFSQPKNNIPIINVPETNESIGKKSKKIKSNRKGENNNNSDDEDDQEKNSSDENKNVLSKEKVLEFQSRSSQEINNFINSLKYYGADVNLEKHRPNKELYPAGKISEPNIKISISSFVKRIEEKLKTLPEYKNIKHNREVAQIQNSNNTPDVQEISPNSSPIYEQNQNINNENNNNEVNADISFSLNHIFNEKSVTYIKISAVIIFVMILGLISVEFALSFVKTKQCAEYIKYLDDSYILLNSFLYTKYFITEVILAQDSNYTDVLKVDQKEYILKAKNEMAEYRQIINDYISFFSNATVSFNKEYNDYIENVQICVRTLSNLIPATEIISYSAALNRIKTSIFFVSTITDNYQSIDMKNRNAYELMMNLLNDYLLMMRNVTFILAKNASEEAKSPSILLIIFVLSFVIVIIELFVIWKLISKFIDDREKPVDLFLTIKKKKFEELKSTSETFLNKLLNKFFGNEETEEESKIEYTSTSKNEDIIMITKFKQKNDYKQSIKNSSEYLFSFIYITLFLTFIEAYMSFKFFYVGYVMSNIKNFDDVFNITHYSESDLIITTNIYKSYYYDSSIPILNSTDTLSLFYLNTLGISDTIEKLYTKTYETSSFLKGKYLDEFSDRMASDISDILTNVSADDIDYRGTIQNGFSCVSTRFFEMNKFLAVLYIKQKDELNETNFCYKPKFSEINKVQINVIRPWFNYMIEELKNRFSDFNDKINLILDSTYVVLLVIVIVMYFLVWKSYEEKLKTLLKTSVDLIKLIPDEIKREIVKKLNEEEEKNE